LESCAWESVARGEGVPEVVIDVGGVGADDRSQWRIEPSDPPETRIGWTGCHATEQTSFFCDHGELVILSLRGYQRLEGSDLEMR